MNHTPTSDNTHFNNTRTSVRYLISDLIFLLFLIRTFGVLVAFNALPVTQPTWRLLYILLLPNKRVSYYYYYYTRLTASFPGKPWVSWYQKDKTSLDLNEARDSGVLGCSGISWTICKQSAPHYRQIITSTPHHSISIGRMLFLTPNQQCQSTEGKNKQASEVSQWWAAHTLFTHTTVERPFVRD